MLESWFTTRGHRSPVRRKQKQTKNIFPTYLSIFICTQLIPGPLEVVVIVLVILCSYCDDVQPFSLVWNRKNNPNIICFLMQYLSKTLSSCLISLKIHRHNKTAFRQTRLFNVLFKSLKLTKNYCNLKELFSILIFF